MSEREQALGLKRGIVFLKEYDARWAELYEEEAAKIRAALGVLAVDIQHVGSTAVPGLAAKPILDIAVGAVRLDDALLCKEPLETLGYEYAHWAGLDENLVFGKGVERTHLIHVVEYNGPIWKNYIIFRDALRKNEAARERYEQLKRELFQKFADNRAAYTTAKGEFIQSLITGQFDDRQGLEIGKRT